MRNKKFAPRKRFSQNFLRDISVIKLIVARSNLSPGEHVIEIGPGEGALTSFLLQSGVDLTAVEVDKDLAAYLRQRYQGQKNLKIIEGDILEYDWTTLIKKDRTNKIVANLPYNISTPLLFKLVDFRKFFHSATIMLQKEVALRLCHSGEGKKLKDYGILSVIFGNLFDIELLTYVSPTCFYPRPKVHSAVIKLFPLPTDIPREKEFFNFVRKAFGLRRKLFVNQLKNNEPDIYRQLSPETLEFLKNLRPENLTPGQYLKLFLKKQL